MIFYPRFFTAQELVSKKVYEQRGNMAFALFDPRLLETLDQLREQFGALTCNNWASGGDRQYSGFRAASEPYHSQYSQHSFGRAADLISARHTAAQMRQYIFDNPTQFPHISFIEEGKGVGWLHIDVRHPVGFFADDQDAIVFWDKNTRKTRLSWR